jgi:pSer/pThr/pTyr-binding forkhead associated (FHA) protein
VQLPDTRISRRHSEIVLRDDRFFIRDLGSRLGTLVNGAKVQERELRDRDEIQVGSTTLMFISAVGNAERSGNVESKRRQDEFNTIWQELTRSAHGN